MRVTILAGEMTRDETDEMLLTLHSCRIPIASGLDRS